MSKRQGSRARKARKAAIAKAAENVPLQIAGVAFNCNGRKGTTGYSSRSSIDAKALHGRTHHATAWNAPSGGGIDRAGGKTGKGAFKRLSAGPSRFADQPREASDTPNPWGNRDVAFVTASHNPLGLKRANRIREKQAERQMEAKWGVKLKS
jgi:hypothetical protein